MDVVIARVFDHPPWHGRICPAHILGQQGSQLADLDNTHAAGILKQQVVLKRAVVVLVPFEIILNPVAVVNDLPDNDAVTLVDKAAPPRLKCPPEMRGQRIRW